MSDLTPLVLDLAGATWLRSCSSFHIQATASILASGTIASTHPCSRHSSAAKRDGSRPHTAMQACR